MQSYTYLVDGCVNIPLADDHDGVLCGKIPFNDGKIHPSIN
jgi:hypothetical protein